MSEHTRDRAGDPASAPRPRLADLEVGQEVARGTYPVTRADLVRYAGASGDLNPIHWNERFAREVGLPDVIAHGMFTMATAVDLVVRWCGDPGAVVDYGVRFTKPVPVPDEGGASVDVVATVGVLDPEAGTARIDLAATCDGAAVLGKARAVVRFR
ncbi:MaoC family dehydratase [Thalassiella azotivora]